MVNRRRTGGKLDVSEDDGILPLFSKDDNSISVPAAGYRNGTSLNNVGENGNYWSSSPNEDNANNSYNINFNSSNHNVDWNNRNNGQSVRPVSELTSKTEQSGCRRHFSISKEILLNDLYAAYKDARLHKRWKHYQLDFEFNLEENLIELRDELWEGRYVAGESTCFIIHDPKMREVFAAQFRDRIVHHLLYNYVHELFEKTFIQDSYSCIPGRGTHYGIDRLKHHIRSVSAGFSKPCYVLKIDIKGYFMSINRGKLLQLCRDRLQKVRFRFPAMKRDWNFIDFLLEKMICFDPTHQCRMIGEIREWKKLPSEKSLFRSRPGCGLPIGNLSSQLFSNIYMNIFDQYVKRVLKCKHYGRYVDDSFVVSADKSKLKSLIPAMTEFLNKELGLKINYRKTRIYDVHHGVEFLGAFIKPYRTYLSSSSLKRITRKVKKFNVCDVKNLQSSINSYLGVFSHYDSYCLRKVLFTHRLNLTRYGKFSNNILKFKPYGL